MSDEEPGHREGPFSTAASPARARLRRAAIELVVEVGAPGVDINRLCGRADVDRRWFEDEFDSLEECLERIYLANVAEFDRVVLGAAAGEPEWRERLRRTAYAAARYVEKRPLETRFDMVQMPAAGDRAMAERDRYVQRIVDLIDEGRQEPGSPEGAPRSVAEAAFGSVYSMLAKRMGEDGEASPVEFVPELMYIAVRPYLGHEVAQQELTKPPPPEPVDG